MKKNTNMELLRVIACLIVIGCHTTLGASENDIYLYHRVVLQCIFADGVAIFWFLSGCFAFKGDYVKGVKRFMSKVFLPSAIFSAVIFYLIDFIYGDKTLAESLTHTSEEYKELFVNLLRFQNPIGKLPHLWYVYVYAIIVIFLFPVYQAIARYLDQNKNMECWFMVVSILFLILNDLSKNTAWGFSHYGITAAVPAGILMIWGHIFYKYKEKFNRWYMAPVFFILFLVINLVRGKVQMWSYLLDGNNHFLFWYTSFGLFAVISLAAGVMSLGNVVSKAEKLILFLGKNTFYIYLVHGINVGWILFRMDFASYLRSWLDKYPYTAATAVGYDVIRITEVFLRSLVISVLIFTVTGLIRSIVKRIR